MVSRQQTLASRVPVENLQSNPVGKKKLEKHRVRSTYRFSRKWRSLQFGSSRLKQEQEHCNSQDGGQAVLLQTLKEKTNAACFESLAYKTGGCLPANAASSFTIANTPPTEIVQHEITTCTKPPPAAFPIRRESKCMVMYGFHLTAAGAEYAGTQRLYRSS